VSLEQIETEDASLQVFLDGSIDHFLMGFDNLEGIDVPSALKFARHPADITVFASGAVTEST
jgi:hypothetical protein